MREREREERGSILSMQAEAVRSVQHRCPAGERIHTRGMGSWAAAAGGVFHSRRRLKAKPGRCSAGWVDNTRRLRS